MCPIRERGGVNQRGRKIIPAMLEHTHTIAPDSQSAAGMSLATETVAMRREEHIVAQLSHAHDAAVRLADERDVIVGFDPDGKGEIVRIIADNIAGAGADCRLHRCA